MRTTVRRACSLVAVEEKQYFYTRKRQIGSASPSVNERIAWRHTVGDESAMNAVLVFRNPYNLDEWIDRAQYLQIKNNLRNQNVPVTSKKGTIPLWNPVNGDRAWLVPDGGRYRCLHVMTDGVWRKVRIRIMEVC